MRISRPLVLTGLALCAAILALLVHRMATRLPLSAGSLETICFDCYYFSVLCCDAKAEGNLALSPGEWELHQAVAKRWETRPNARDEVGGGSLGSIQSLFSCEAIHLIRQGLVFVLSLFALSDDVLLAHTNLKPCWREEIKKEELWQLLDETEQRVGGFDPITSRQKEYVEQYLGRAKGT